MLLALSALMHHHSTETKSDIRPDDLERDNIEIIHVNYTMLQVSDERVIKVGVTVLQFRISTCEGMSE